MTRLEKIKLAIEKGYRYNEKTGIVTSPKGKELNRANNMGYIYLAPYKDGKTHMLLVHQFAWYCVYKETVECIDHINQVKTDNRIENFYLCSRTEHMRVHDQFEKLTSKLVKNGTIGFKDGTYYFD
jgi:hypothetical protein